MLLISLYSLSAFLVPSSSPSSSSHVYIYFYTREAFNRFSKTEEALVSPSLVAAMSQITRAIGSQGTIEEQYKEFSGTFKKKEGELQACGAACGAILGGGSEEEIELLRRYGFCVGKIQEMGPNKEFEELKNLAIKEVKRLNVEKI